MKPKRTDLMQLERISIPRCFKPDNFDRIISTELHHFSDASTEGYGQCSYLRLVNEDGRVHCAFVMGKSRVVPLKSTIPRLELTAAVCSVRISEQIHRELDYPVDQDFFWTDSKVVLGYINNESRRFHIFVSNRVQEMQDSTSASQCKHVESQDNPADEACRGMKARELQDSRLLLGPTFLWKNENEWSISDKVDHSLDVLPDDPEVKRSVVMTTKAMETRYPDIAGRVERFSDWFRAKRAVAICIKYVRKLKNRVNKSKEETRSFQASAFREEIDTLKRNEQTQAKENKENLKFHSAIYKLDPFIDNEGTLRVGGRLKNADLPSPIKHPVILPRGSHVSSLIIRHFHERVGHRGKGITLNEVRGNGYWIIGGISAVNSAIGSCFKCRKLRAPVVEQKMSDLPEDRLECHPPFTYCAVDYFGPFSIKENRKELKRYGVLFTCMASRAIDLETATSLKTDSFRNALRRFLSRRGPVRQIRCDQGTNLVGARRELKEALAKMDHSDVKVELQRSHCDWIDFKMNVPAASHMGGVWERQIRTVRSVLFSLLASNGRQPYGH